MLFFLKFQRNNQQNALAMDSAKGKILRESLHFHRVVEMKQPHTMTEPIEKERFFFNFSSRLQAVILLVFREI